MEYRIYSIKHLQTIFVLEMTYPVPVFKPWKC